jgi:hypothetical protein
MVCNNKQLYELASNDDFHFLKTQLSMNDDDCLFIERMWKEENYDYEEFNKIANNNLQKVMPNDIVNIIKEYSDEYECGRMWEDSIW